MFLLREKVFNIQKYMTENAMRVLREREREK